MIPDTTRPVLECTRRMASIGRLVTGHGADTRCLTPKATVTECLSARIRKFSLLTEAMAVTEFNVAPRGLSTSSSDVDPC